MYYSDDNNDAIIKKIEDRLDHMIERHNKVLLVRLDAHFPTEGYVPDGRNGEVSRLVKSLKETYVDKGHEVQFIWAREKTPEAPHHHYHLAIMMDGALMQNPRGLQAKADAVWSNLLGGSFENRVHFCQQDRGGRKAQGAVMIHRPSSKATGQDRIDQEQRFNKQREEAIYAASYLAKNHTKDDTLPPRTRRFGASEL